MKMKYQICVSGAASGETVMRSKELAFKVGVAIAKAGKTLTTGATVGLPMFAAAGFKSVPNARGVSVGFSPAATFKEHILAYRLPTLEFDYINFTGMAYVGRDVHLVRSSDAVITIGGRMGSLHEFSTALESHKVCGVLLGSGGLADYIPALLQSVEAPNMDNVVYGADPEKLVKKVIARLDKIYEGFENDGTDAHVSQKHFG
jgi:uncharacterized protein (TIGR00725 family)